MKEEKIIQKLLGLGFRDKSYSADNPRFELDINGFSLNYEKGKFKLEGNGGYDDAGEMDLDHFQLEDIKPLYRILTGKAIEEVKVSFNFKEWKDKLRKEAEELEESFKNRFPELLGTDRFPGKELGFLDALTNISSMGNPTKFEWSEMGFVSKSDDIPKL